MNKVLAGLKKELDHINWNIRYYTKKKKDIEELIEAMKKK